MSKSQSIAFFEEISRNQQLAKEIEKVIEGKASDEAKSKKLISLANKHGFNFTQEDAIEAQSELKKSLSPKDLLEVSGGDGFKSSVMAMALLACLGGGVSTLSNTETSAMKPNHQQAGPQAETDFREDPILAWFNSHRTTTYFDENSVILPAPSLYDEQHQDGTEHAGELSFDEDFEENNERGTPSELYLASESTQDGFNSHHTTFYFDERFVMVPVYDEQPQDGTEPASELSFDEDFEENDEMEPPSELYLAQEASQEQHHRVPYVFLNYHGDDLYQGDISETLAAFGATARIAALPPDEINCALKLYGRDWGGDDDSYFLLNFDISKYAVCRGTGLLIVSPGNAGLRIHFKVQESFFRNRILLWFEKVDGEVNVPDNWGILSIDSSSHSTPQLFVMNCGDIRFTTAEGFELDQLGKKIL